MKTSTSFAILAIFASAPSVLGAPLPAQSSEGLGATLTLYTEHSTYTSVGITPTGEPKVLAQTSKSHSHTTTTTTAKDKSHPSVKHAHPSTSASASTTAKQHQHNSARDIHNPFGHVGEYLKSMHILKGDNTNHDETDVHVHGRDVITNDVASVASTVTNGGTGKTVLPSSGPVKSSQLGSGAILDPATKGGNSGNVAALVHSTTDTVLEAGTSLVGAVISTDSGVTKTVSGIGSGSGATIQNVESTLTKPAIVQNDINPIEKNVNVAGGATSIISNVSLPVSTAHGLTGSFRTGQTGKTLQPLNKTVQHETSSSSSSLPVPVPVNGNDGNGNGNVGHGVNTVLNGKTAIDPISAQTLPSGNENQNSLISVSQKNVNAKFLQTPGKADSLIDQNTNSIMNTNTNTNSTQGQGHVDTSNTDTRITINQPLKSSGDGIVYSKGGKIGPEDHNGNVVNQAKETEHKILGNTTSTSTAILQLKNTAIPNHVDITHTTAITSSTTSSTQASISPKPTSTSFAHDQALIANKDNKVTSASASSVIHSSASTTSPITSVASVTLATGTVEKVVASITKEALKPLQSVSVPTTLSINTIHASKVDIGNPITTSVTKNSQLPKQAQTIYNERSSSIVPCDGLIHSSSDIIDQCISSSLISTKPLGTQVCPDELQKDINYIAPNSLDNDTVQSVVKYVRLCVESAK